MAGQGKLCKLFSLFGNYRNILSSRLNVTPVYLQNASLKMETKEKLKSLNIPEHPKRPLTPYFQFLKEHRPLLRKEHPDWKLIQVTKQCAQDWKSISESLKQKYQEQYSKELAEYEKQSQKYSSLLTKEQSEALALARMEKKESKKKRIVRKRYRETAKPKRPKGSFLFFIEEKWALPENKNKKLVDMLSTYKVEWNGLSSSHKQKYIDMHNEDKKRYEKEMSDWELKMIKEGNADIIRKESQFLAAGEHSHIHSSKQKKVE